MMEAGSQRGGSVNARRILLVDDSVVYLRAATRVLERRGFVVVAVDGPGVALTAFAQAEYDVVVSDVQMPDMDGFDLVKLLRASRPCVPMILVSGDPAHDTEERALRTGAAAFVPKCAGAVQLCTAIDAALAWSAPGEGGPPSIT